MESHANYATLSQAMKTLRERGYSYDFNLHKEVITVPKLRRNLSPNECEIQEVYRFEGMSSAGDNSVLYAVASSDGLIKGVLVDAYGTYAEAVSPEMAKKLQRVK